MGDAVLRGSLAAFRLADVLAFLSAAKKKGTLTVSVGPNESRLLIEEGALVSAATNQGALRGGEATEIAYDAFLWPDGEFAFVEHVALSSQAVTTSIDLAGIIAEGTRRREEWDECVRLLPDRRAVFRVVIAPRDEKIVLTSDEWKVLFLIDGKRTLDDLWRDSRLDRIAVYRLVHGLMEKNLVELVAREESDAEATYVAPPTRPMPSLGGESTVRQDAPSFGAESTMRDTPDDTALLVRSNSTPVDAVMPALVARLTIDGDGDTRVVALTGPEYLIGRHRDNTIQLVDPGVSGFHARIYRSEDGYVVEDLKSRNGVWVNDNRVYHATLQSGDRVHIGQTDLLYEVVE